MEGVQEQAEVETQEPIIEAPVEEVTPDVVEAPAADDGPKPGESALETTKREFEKLKNEGEPQKEEVTAKEPKIEDIDPELLPPERLRQQERQLFNNLPKGLKRGLHRVIKDLESGSTKTIQEHQRQAAESRYIVEAVQPFASKWGSQGFSIPQGIVSLASAQEKLTDPATSYQTFVRLGVDLGHIPVETAKQLIAARTPGAPSTPQSQQNYIDPQVSTLQQRIDRLEQEREQQEIQRAAAPIVEQMKAVRDEINPATGKLRYPELHNGDYLVSLRPRIVELRRLDPSLSHGEALRQANEQTKAAQAQLFGYSVPAVQNNIRPLAANTQVQNRAASAAVTVRGKSLSTTPGNLDFNPPPEALRPNDARATAQWAYDQLSRG